MSDPASHSSASRNVLLVVRWPIGGIRTYLRYVLGSASFREYRFTLLTTVQEPQAEAALRAALADVNVTYVFCEPGLWKLFAAVRQQASSARYALIHSHGISAAVLTALPAKLRRIPHVTTAHEVFTARQFVGRRGRAKRFALGTILGLVDIIHTVSNDARGNLAQFFPRLGRARVVTVRNGISVNAFDRTEARPLRAELQLSADTFLIGFLGRFMSPKGFRYLIEAVESLSREGTPRPFAVVAVGDGGFIREDHQVIREKGIERYFHFLPFVDSVAPVLRGLDVVAVPSLWEACPLLPMEAMVAGTPVIGSNCIGLREVLEGTPATVVAAGDGPALARALRMQLLEPIKYANAAREYSPQAAIRFDVEQSASGMAALYRDLIRESA